MRYALLSDVHANLPALEAVIADIGRRTDIDATYHLGDLVGYGPWPNEIVDLMRDLGIGGVAGNYDSTIATGYEHCGCRYEDAIQQELAHLSYEWTRRTCSPATARFLGALPFRIDHRPDGGHRPGPSVILVHGTPTLNTLYWSADRSESFSLKLAHAAGARAGDVICFGHTHVAWEKEVGRIRIVNTGSVGRPKDGDWRAGYVVLDMSREAPAVEFVRVEYDLQRAVAGIRKSDLPDEFAAYLAMGGQGNLISREAAKL
ncbi:MAG: metallophosphoesterase [Gemmatimonas sp.]|nr:metallophosphoesterase [Gemmatimonas sp.]